MQHRNTKLLRQFFILYAGKMIFHNALFDCKHIIHQFFPNNPDSRVEMHKGLYAFKNVEDSMLYTYIAKNSRTEVKLDLKSNSLEFAGNYAVDVKDATKLPTDVLLEYNLKDCLATWFVYDKYRDIVIRDNLLESYLVVIFQGYIF